MAIEDEERASDDMGGERKRGGRGDQSWRWGPPEELSRPDVLLVLIFFFFFNLMVNRVL